MATYTDNYNLEKPAQSDLYNVDVFNENADKIDEALGDKAENQSLAPIESSSTASRNYSVGQQFVYNGLLYEATAAIASGGTISPGTNCARTTVAEELSALNDSLNNRAFTPTAGNNVTLNNVNCYENGFMAFACLQFTVSAQIGMWETIVSGFPSSLGNVEVTLIKSDASVIRPAFIENGNLKNRNTNITAGIYFITVAYLKS